MKRIDKYLIALALLPVVCFGQTDQFRTLDNESFVVGEKLTYSINYGPVTAGLAEMEIPAMKKISGREAYYVTFKVNNFPSFDALYKVRDRYVTYIDKEGLFPWRFEQHIREGGYKRDFSAFFDHRRGVAKTSEGSYKIPLYVNDIVSALYLARTFDYSAMKPGDRVHLENFYKDKVYPLDVVYHGKETVEVEAGKFECIILEPLVVEGGLFKAEGNIVVWMTDDKMHIPVKVKTKVVVGAIDAELRSYSGLKNEIAAIK